MAHLFLTLSLKTDPLMDILDLPITWNLEQILDDLAQHGFSVIDNAYPATFAHEVLNECMDNLQTFRDASIQNGVHIHIRSDHILWIDTQLEIAQQHIHTLNILSDALNRAFFLGINNIEAHFACYNAGEFYALHRDNPHGKNGRVISTVYYLHQAWEDHWGGQLHFKDKNNVWHTLVPKPNRIALFQSDLLHEVQLAQQQRLSITAWLRNDQSIW